MYGYIYETTNLINNKKYIGKHKAKEFHPWYLGSGTAIGRAIRKYGKENFSVRILEEVDSYSLLNLRETYYIEKYNAVKNKAYYNNSYGGENEGWEGVNRANKETGNNHWLGRHHSKESREKISRANLGRKRSEEQKQKLRGRKLSEESRERIRKGHIGIKFSEEHKEKISKTQIGKNNSMYGKHLSEKAKKKISENGSNRSWMNDGIIEKWVNKEEINLYLSRGFTLGRIYKKRRRNRC